MPICAWLKLRYPSFERIIEMELHEYPNSSFEEKKEKIIEELKKRGYRLTSQRLTLIDTILNENCTCCKEIYYEVQKIDPAIGIATVYRMVSMLEDIGLIDRRGYQLKCENECETGKGRIFLQEHNNNQEEIVDPVCLYRIRRVLKEFGYLENDDISVWINKHR